MELEGQERTMEWKGRLGAGFFNAKTARTAKEGKRGGAGLMEREGGTGREFSKKLCGTGGRRAFLRF